MAFALQIKGIQQALQNIDKYSKGVQQAVQDELKATAYEIVNMAQELAPVDDGNLRANIRVILDDPYNKLIESGAIYSAYVEFGTGTNVNIPPTPEWLGLAAGVGSPEQPGSIAEYAMQFKGAGLQGRHPVKFKDGSWRLVPYQVNLRARPFFFPAIQANTVELPKRIKEILDTGK